MRLAAGSLHSSKSALGEFFGRMRARLGRPKAITATGHQLARILYHLLRSGHAYDESVFAQSEERYQQRRIRRLHREAAALGYARAPKTPVP